MFDTLQNKLETAFRRIRGRGLLDAKDIEATLKEVRLALLEADVNFKVAKEFCEEVSKKACAQEVLRSLAPDQQVIKLVHQQLAEMMGSEAAALNLNVAPPAVIMLVGLQGSGKTTTAAKLARLLSKEYRRKPLLVPLDVYRPAAIEQLKTLGGRLDISVFDSQPAHGVQNIAQQAHAWAQQRGFDALLLDTAGRLQIDLEMMNELQEIKAKLIPHEILLVADCMTGQEAVNVAKGFNDALRIDGLILTKLDGDARGGAALSMRAVTGCPIKFIGVGEKSDALEVFYPQRMASRILGMGDMLTLIEKAAKGVAAEDALAWQKKLKKDGFSLEDFLQQMSMVRRMGSLGSLAALIPGAEKLMRGVNEQDAERQMKKVEAIILSMTPQERRNHGIINGSRRRRIAKGSGTNVEEVNRLLKQFMDMRKMLSSLSKLGGGGILNLLRGRLPSG